MKVTLRKANGKDLPLMLAWRSNPMIYSQFYQQKAPLRWEEHSAWFADAHTRYVFIVEAEGRPVGVIVLKIEESCPAIDYYLRFASQMSPP